MREAACRGGGEEWRRGPRRVEHADGGGDEEAGHEGAEGRPGGRRGLPHCLSFWSCSDSVHLGGVWISGNMGWDREMRGAGYLIHRLVLGIGK